MKRLIKLLLALMLCFSLSAGELVNASAASLTLNVSNYEILTVGQTKKIFNEKCTSYKLTITSKDESVCFADSKFGILMPIGEGSTKVTIKAKKGSTTVVSKTITVYVEDPGNVKVGGDVSYWDGTVDAKRLKKDGFDFLIIRAGHTHSDAKTTTYSTGEDKKFKTNINKCESAGLQYGTYWYLDCKTTSAAKAETKAYYKVLSKYDILDSDLFAYPIYLDIEGNLIKLSKTKLLSVVKAFINQLTALGVDGDRISIYASKLCYENKLNNSYYNQYYAKSWFARYGTDFYSDGIGCRPTYQTTDTYAPVMWQIGSSFIKKNKGISETYIDMDYYYDSDSTEIHTYSNKTVTEPTCEENGAISYTCNICGNQHYDTITKLGHSYSTPVFSFSDDGSKATVTYTCSRCNESFTYDATVTSKVKTKATCVKKGTTRYTAIYGSDSSYVDIQDIDMVDHTVVESEQVDATCTTAGLTAGSYCSVCGKIFSGREEIAATGHNYEEVSVKATLTKDGYTGKKCSKCNDVVKDEVYRYAKTVALSQDSYSYDGKVKSPKVIVKDSKGNVIDTSEYDVTIPEGRIEAGIYTYTVTFKDHYSDKKTLTLTVTPKKTSISSLKKYKKAIGVKVKVQKNITGYQVKYSTSSKFSNAKYKDMTSTYKKITGLKAKKKYYVKVRTYKIVDGTKIYSSWSTTKKIKTK